MSGFLSRFNALNRLFVITVIVPTALAVVYFGFIASDVYVSESQFVVRSPEKSGTSGLGVLLKGVGFSNAGDEIYLAQGFLQSRDALVAVNRGGEFQKAYQKPSISIADRFDPWGFGSSFEDLYQYYGQKVSVEFEASTSITRLTVKAYDAESARKFNTELLNVAEATVNRLNIRGRQDLIGFASAEVDAAKLEAQQAALKLAEFRNREGVVDPEKQATVQLQMISKVQDELIITQAQLAELKRSAPQNPQVAALQTRIGVLSGLIEQELGKVAGDRSSLSSTAARYQRLLLDSQFAERQLTAAMASLQDARNEARRKQAYVERIVNPNLPDDPLEPRRWRGILSALILGLVAWAISSMLLAGLREHRD